MANYKPNPSLTPAQRAQNLRVGMTVGGFFILIGLIGIIAGMVVLFQTRAFINKAKIAPGRVTDLVPERTSHNHAYHVVFTFADDSSNVFVVRTPWGQRPQPYQAGDSLTVLYPPDEPQSARIRSFVSLWLAPSAMGGGGLLFASVGTFCFFAARKTYRPPESAHLKT